MKENYNDKYVYVDLFGGSGLLSHFVRSVFPKAVIIYNDYDNFSERLSNIEETNRILSEIRTILTDYPRGKLVTEPARSKIIKMLTVADKNGYVDYITLSSSLMFSMKYCTSLEAFIKESFYNNVKMSDYNAEGYLDGIHVVRMDYKELFKKYQYRPDVVFLIDPPYLSTDVSTYTGDYWKLKDYLDVLNTLKNTNYFYFTSDKSNIIELCDWLEKNTNFINPFNALQKVELFTQLNHTSRYTDIMLWKKA